CAKRSLDAHGSRVVLSNREPGTSAWSLFRRLIEGVFMAEQSTVEGTSARKEMILAAAAELVAERGFARTTVRDIGKRIGMLSGSLYHYFESKEAIADELLNRFWV